MSTWKYDQSTESNLLKRTYGQHIDKQFNEDNILFARANKKNDLEGDSFRMPVEQSIGGGVSSGGLGQSSRNKNLECVLTSKDLYAVVTIDRKSMKLAKSDKGSFVRFTKYPVKTAVRSFNRNLERMMTLNDISGKGTLGTAASVTGTGTTLDPYVYVLGATDVMEAFEEGDLLHVNDDNDDADAVEVVSVDVDAQSVSVVGQPSVAPAAADELHIQKSKGNELPGLVGILTSTSGFYNGIDTAERRWQATQVDAAAAAVTVALINKILIKLIKTCGEKPTLALSSFEQYQALLDLHEDQKTYNLPAKSAKYKEQISFEGIEIMTAKGRIPVVPSRFVPKDTIMFINDDKMYLKCTKGGFEWFDEDGTVFLREGSADAYGARYGGYVAFHVNPHFQAILTNLAVPA